jgi:hypothetical protein
MIVQGLVFKLFGWNNKGGPLGNGVKEAWVINLQKYQAQVKQGKVDILLDLVNLDEMK